MPDHSEDRKRLSASPPQPAARVEGWRDMSSAPKDGTRITGLNRRHGRVFLCWWQPEFDAWISGARVMTMAPGYTIDGKSEKLHSPETVEPTHWMPFSLPALDGSGGGDE